MFTVITMDTLNKNEKESTKSLKPTIMRTFALITIFWTATILFFVLSANSCIYDKTFQLTLERARSVFQMIVDMRAWNASHGGVYVFINHETQPNSFLNVSNRDIISQNGQKLTIINPAYMTRQLSEIAKRSNNILFYQPKNY